MDMGKAFYRKYRSKSLSEVVGQAHITDALTTALKDGAISHAYLFTGPRGVGKTSVARILAHEINQLPYTDESTHLDIIEIDAASNRRIDEIRDLKDKVNIAPTSAKYKVYIIDEVHMLTKEAFNALLKTLEEPPAHVVFILATTEAHKLPETIISRTQRFTFKPVDQSAVIAHLAGIAKQEGIKVDQAALQIIAEHGEGSFRDSISLLDQMRSSSTAITAIDVENALGIAPKQLIQETIAAINQANRGGIEQALADITSKGVDLVQFSHQLALAVRNQMLTAKTLDTSDLQLLDELARIGTHPNPSIALALALYRPLASTAAPKPALAAKSEEILDLRSQISDKTEATPKSKIQDLPSPKEPLPEPGPSNEPYEIEELPPMAEEEVVVSPTSAKASKKTDVGEWESILNALKGRYNTLYGVVRMADPVMDDTNLTLAFSFPFHIRRVKEEKNRRIIEDVIFETVGKRLNVSAVKQEKPAAKAPKPAAPAPKPDSLTSVSNIFGGAEIVES